jgi:hypothetical protein
MPDLLWDDVRNFFDPDLMGALPDVRVPNTSVADWQAVLDLVRSRGWAYAYSEGGAPDGCREPGIWRRAGPRRVPSCGCGRSPAFS